MLIINNVQIKKEKRNYTNKSEKKEPSYQGNRPIRTILS